MNFKQVQHKHKGQWILNMELTADFCQEECKVWGAKHNSILKIHGGKFTTEKFTAKQYHGGKFHSRKFHEVKKFTAEKCGHSKIEQQRGGAYMSRPSSV